jgi:hypothetical protein
VAGWQLSKVVGCKGADEQQNIHPWFGTSVHTSLLRPDIFGCALVIALTGGYAIPEQREPSESCSVVAASILGLWQCKSEEISQC